MNRSCIALLLWAWFGLISEAGATWTIAAMDTQTREVGVAGASCILGTANLDLVAELVPGVGAVVAQAFTNLNARAQLAELIGQGKSPHEAIAVVTSAGTDAFLGFSLTRLRQYGVVTLRAEDAPANFTGSWNYNWAGAGTGRTVTVQGNSLWGEAVVNDSLAAFEESPSTCLAERLLAALTAGARAGGDARCSRDLAALSAFVVVAQPEDLAGQPSFRLLQTRPGEPPVTLWIELHRNLIEPEQGTADENPVFLLRDVYEAERDKGNVPPSCRQ